MPNDLFRRGRPLRARHDGAVGVVESRSGGAGRDPERLGDLGRRKPEEVVQDEDGPLLGRQAPEPTIELVAVSDREQVVGCRRSVDREQPQVRGAATLARRLGDADTDHEAGQPRIEPVRIAEVPEVTPGDHQRVLQGVLGPVDVTEDPLGGREQAVAAHADQVDEGRLVAVLCCRQELAIHSWASAAPLGGTLPTLQVDRASATFILHSPAAPGIRTSSRPRSTGGRRSRPRGSRHRGGRTAARVGRRAGEAWSGGVGPGLQDGPR